MSTNDRADDMGLEDLVERFFARKTGGSSRDVEEYSRQHPEHADELLEVLPMMKLLQGAARVFDEGDGQAKLQAVQTWVSQVGAIQEASAEPFSHVLERLADRESSYDRYEVKGEISRGGQGAVKLVWDADLRRHLAMKVLLQKKGHSRGETPPEARSPGTDSRTLGRFLEEAQITAQLDHPGIVPVHELGLQTDGGVYFTMKLVKGRDLEAVLRLVRDDEEDWNRTRALGALLKVCEAMAFAHSKGVLHRDLKPSNVMVGRFGEVYVMDWGLARLLGGEDGKDIRIRPGTSVAEHVNSDVRDEPSDADSPLITMDGDVVGTPAYMSPEQAAGNLSAMGPHSDVYSVGAMLYQLLAGHMPYVRKGTRLGNRAVWDKVQEGPPEPLHELARDTPVELLAICERAMARKPADRYGDMMELAEDLRAFLEQRVVLAYETGSVAELRKWVRRNRSLAGSLTAAALLLFVGLAVALVLKSDAAAKAVSVLQLSALQDLEDLGLEAHELWPPHPENVEDYLDWIERARELLARLPEYREDRDAVRARALPRTEGEDWQFSESAQEDRWWHNQLSKLIEDLEALDDREEGLLGAGISPTHGWGIRRRLMEAERLRDGFEPAGEFQVRWDEDLSVIRADYPELELTPQMGLVPIGRDPSSGMWEFWHVVTGDEPIRRTDDTLAMTEESGVVLVLLPGGSFWMGSQDEDPEGPNYSLHSLDNETAHEVPLSPFFMSKYEMTQGQWKRLVGRNPSVYGPDGDWRPESSYLGSNASLLLPVEQVSWRDCMRELPRVGLALPTEAQWEFACRAGTDTPWWTGPDMYSLQDAANLADEFMKVTGGYTAWPHVLDWLWDGYVFEAPVDTLLANPFGLHHVHGNVWEWCMDGFDNGFYMKDAAQELDTVAPYGDDVQSRIARGGCSFYHWNFARSAHREFKGPDAVQRYTGVRPARAITK